MLIDISYFFPQGLIKENNYTTNYHALSYTQKTVVNWIDDISTFLKYDQRYPESTCFSMFLK